MGAATENLGKFHDDSRVASQNLLRYVSLTCAPTVNSMCKNHLKKLRTVTCMRYQTIN